MRKTLRRSCDACAKAKHRCDLLIPCSRCTERQLRCVYANLPAGENNGLVKTISNLGARSLDPVSIALVVNPSFKRESFIVREAFWRGSS
jgi:hypothetical protein